MIYTWWKGTQLSKFFTITEKECLEHGKDLIESSLRKNIPIKQQIGTYTLFLNGMKRRKDNKLAIRRSDHLLAFHSLMALCYLKIVNLDDYDTGIFISQKKRKTSPSKQINLVG